MVSGQSTKSKNGFKPSKRTISYIFHKGVVLKLTAFLLFAYRHGLHQKGRTLTLQILRGNNPYTLFTGVYGGFRSKWFGKVEYPRRIAILLGISYFQGNAGRKITGFSQS